MDWRTKSDALAGPIKALMVAKPSAVNAQQLQALQNQRKQNVLDHITELQAAIGAGRFLKLDSFVRATSTLKQSAVAAPVQAGKEPL